MSAARSCPVILEVPAAKILTQTVRSPAAALENLDDAVRFGLSTWTPFEADEVVFHADVVERTDDHARIRVRMVPLAALTPAVDRAARLGLAVSAVAFGQDLARFGEAGERLERRRSRTARTDLALASSAAALAAGTLLVLHLGWAQELDDLQTAVRAEISHRAKQTKLEQDLAQLESRTRAALTKRAAEIKVSAVMSEIAERLPDTAEVLEFEWSGRQGRLRVSVPPDVNLGAAIELLGLVSVKRERDGRDGAQTFVLTAKAAQ